MENEMMRDLMEEATEEVIPVAQAIAEETVVPAAQEVVKELPTIAAEVAAPVTKKAKHSPKKTIAFVITAAVAGAAFMIKKTAEKKKADKEAKEQERINALVDKRVDEKLAALGFTQQPTTEETKAETNETKTDSTEETAEKK